MQRINLSTRKKTAAAPASSLPSWLLGGLAVLLLLFLGGHYLLRRHDYHQRLNRLQQLETRYMALQEQSRNYQVMIDRIRGLEKQYAATEKQLQVAESIKARRRDWYSIVAAISRQVPDRVWLTEISSSSRNPLASAAGENESNGMVPKIVVTITGRALDSPAIVHYLKNLQSETDVLAAVDFSEVTRVKADDNTGIPAHFSFIVSCQLK